MDLLVLLALVASIAAAAFIVGRLMQSDDSDGIMTVTLRGWRQPGWPRGVQEEEPVALQLTPARPAPCVVADCPEASVRRVNRRNAFPVRVA
jgi:hypothetical protein